MFKKPEKVFSQVNTHIKFIFDTVMQILIKQILKWKKKKNGAADDCSCYMTNKICRKKNSDDFHKEKILLIKINKERNS